jgi:outer membrane assembly lipoprotein YfiO
MCRLSPLPLSGSPLGVNPLPWFPFFPSSLLPFRFSGKCTLFFLTLTLSPLLLSCATAEKPPPSAEEIYARAVTAATPSGLFASRDCLEVERLFTEMRTRYPYNQRALDLEALLAECYFAQGEYPQAAAHWRILVENYPGHEQVPEYLFHLIQSLLKMVDDYDLDLTHAYSAWGYADQFLRNHPTHSLSGKVFELRGLARSWIARREFYVAKFYLKNGAWLSAYDRLSYLSREFSDLKEGKEAESLLKELSSSRTFPAKITEEAGLSSQRAGLAPEREQGSPPLR